MKTYDHLLERLGRIPGATVEDVRKTEADKAAVGDLVRDMITEGGAEMFYEVDGRLHRVFVKDGKLTLSARPVSRAKEAEIRAGKAVHS